MARKKGRHVPQNKKQKQLKSLLLMRYGMVISPIPEWMAALCIWLRWLIGTQEWHWINTLHLRYSTQIKGVNIPVMNIRRFSKITTLKFRWTVKEEPLIISSSKDFLEYSNKTISTFQIIKQSRSSKRELKHFSTNIISRDFIHHSTIKNRWVFILILYKKRHNLDNAWGGNKFDQKVVRIFQGIIDHNWKNEKIL